MMVKLKARQFERVCFVWEWPHLHGLSPEWQQTNVWPLPLGGKQGLWLGWFPHAESEFYCDDLWWCHLWSKPHCHLWNLSSNTTTNYKVGGENSASQAVTAGSTGRMQTLSLCLTNSHEVEVFMYTETRHFSRFVARNCGENPSAQRISTVPLVKVPHLYLKNEYRFSLVVVH